MEMFIGSGGVHTRLGISQKKKLIFVDLNA